MTYVKMGDFESLYMVTEVNEILDNLDNDDLDKIMSALAFFDKYGTYTNYYKVDFLEGKGYTDIFEIKINLSSKRIYRILATKLSTKKRPADYLLLHAFFKKDTEIKTKDKKLARKRMIAEGL